MYLIAIGSLLSPALLVAFERRCEAEGPSETWGSSEAERHHDAEGRREASAAAVTPAGRRAEGRFARGGFGVFLLAIASMALYGFVLARVQSIGSDQSMAAFVATPIDWRTIAGTALGAVVALATARVAHPRATLRVFVLVAIIVLLWVTETVGIVDVGVNIALMCLMQVCMFAQALMLACDEARAGECRGASSVLGIAFALAWGVYLVSLLGSTTIFDATADQGSAADALYSVAIAVSVVALVLLEILPRVGKPGDRTLEREDGDDAVMAPVLAGEPSDGGAPAFPANVEADAGADDVAAYAAAHGLAARETEVAALLLAGRSTPDIAAELGMGAETAKTHVRRIYRKLGVHSRDELASAFDEWRQG